MQLLRTSLARPLGRNEIRRRLERYRPTIRRAEREPALGLLLLGKCACQLRPERSRSPDVRHVENDGVQHRDARRTRLTALGHGHDSLPVTHSMHPATDKLDVAGPSGLGPRPGWMFSWIRVACSLSDLA